MTTKHTPATPLPWRYRVTAVGGAFVGPAEITKQRSERCGQDAAYIAHAANAYPRLVEALRDLFDDQAKSNTLESLTPNARRHVETARALLRELGEL